MICELCRYNVDDMEDVVFTPRVTLRPRQRNPDGIRPTSIAERLSQLYESQESWKSKVEEKDVDQFTVEGKMNRLGQCDPAWHGTSWHRRRRRGVGGTCPQD